MEITIGNQTITLVEETNWNGKFDSQTKRLKEWLQGDHRSDTKKKYSEEEDGKKDKCYFDEYLRGTHIAAIGRGKFTNQAKEKVRAAWSDIVTIIKEVINSKDDGELINNCKTLQEKLSGCCGEDKKPWAAIHAMVIAVRPDVFCSIAAGNNLDDLYKKLQELHPDNEDNDSEPTTASDKIDESQPAADKIDENQAWKILKNSWKDIKHDDMAWYHRSIAIKKYFNAIVSANDPRKDHYPWVTLVALRGEKNIEIMAQRLEKQKNIILTGAPGTGKTFLARRIAAKMIECDPKVLKKEGQYEFVQFHPSYDYTDFVEGLRPKSVRGQIVFERRDGIFKEFCKKAAIAAREDSSKADSEKRKFVFVIDEINRGEISKIFGELFFSIDPGYRGEKDDNGNDNKVNTQYQNLVPITDEFKWGFYVPENVYIIGTMNDIDRSVESMDFAFRRRFSFIEISASDSKGIVYSTGSKKGWDPNVIQDTVDRMESLNKAIINKCNLPEQYQIGGAYFQRLENVDFDFNKLWDEYLKGTLYEYFRGLPSKEIEDKMSILKDAYQQGYEG